MAYFGHEIVNDYQNPGKWYDPKKGHTGIDMMMPVSTSLYINTQAEVVSIKNQPEMGLTLYLKDPDGNILVFAHLNHTFVSKGQQLAANDLLALSGNTGSATTGPHLHFEIIAEKPESGGEHMTRTLGEFSGYNIDPKSYLDGLGNHWSDEAMGWMLKHEIITEKRDPNTPVSWGEFAVVTRRLAEKLIEWSSVK